MSRFEAMLQLKRQEDYRKGQLLRDMDIRQAQPPKSHKRAVGSAIQRRPVYFLGRGEIRVMYRVKMGKLLRIV